MARAWQSGRGLSRPLNRGALGGTIGNRLDRAGRPPALDHATGLMEGETMDKLEQMEARHKAERERLAQELAIAAAMPIAPDACQPTKTGAPWVHYRNRTVTEAIAIFEAFDVVPVYHAKDSFGHIKPEALLPAGAVIKAGPFAAWINVSMGAGYGPTADLRFAATVAGAPYEIHISIKGPDYIGACTRFAPTVDERRSGATGRGRVVSRNYGANRLLNGLCDRVVSWAGAGGAIKESAMHSYLICADDDATVPGGEQSHALGQLRNIADALEPSREV